MKLLVAAALVAASLAVAASGAPADDVDCSKVEAVIDEMGPAQGFTSLNPKYKFAATEEEYAKRCKEMKEAIRTLKRYNNKCYTQLTQQVFSAILRTRSAHNDNYCDIGTADGKLAYESVKCINDHAQEATKAAELKLILYSQVLLDANIADEPLRLRQACCSILAGKRTFLEAFKDKCSKYEKVYDSYVDSYSSEAMGLICAEPEKLECDKLPKLKYEGVEVKSKFFLNPMLKLVKTLDH